MASEYARQGPEDKAYRHFYDKAHEALWAWANKRSHSGEWAYNSTSADIYDKNDEATYQKEIDKLYELYKTDPQNFHANLRKQKESAGYIRDVADFMDPNDDIFMDPEKRALQDKQMVEADARKPGQQALDEFARHMMSPLDHNDPYVQSITQMASRAASQDAMHRGIQGGYASGNVGRAVARAGTDIQMQRNTLGAQAMQSSIALGQGQQALDASAYDRLYQNQMGQMQNSYNSGRQQAQATGALIGGGLGAIASFIPGLGAMAPALIGGGSALGGGIGGMTYGNSPPTMQYRPPAMGSGGGVPQGGPSYGYSPRGSY